ncbi:MAG: sigma-54-dependent Fis family transcriptional regulator [Deltaproteobacteria bacterium]|nr:sigma-54-dependent Fis family transcriptional regulator [Deltaproteobacteria bacterium]
MKIMVIDDEESMRHMLSVILKREGYETAAFADAGQAVAALEASEFDFVLCDIRMPGMDGMRFLKTLQDRGLGQTVIMMSAYGAMDTAIECMKLGAYDYISKPFKADEIILTVKKAEERERLKRENARLKDEAERDYDFRNIITEDRAMLEIIGLVKKVADYATPVLITGESGTGKELVARAIHHAGQRGLGPFVAVNCGAIPPNLLESELFGHVKGAFTDAHRNKTGLFQEADHGTIFLDEIGELPMELQVKLLRTLQEGEIRRVGDVKSARIDARVVAATVKDLKTEIKAGRFREDLYYRLNVIETRLPPLRDRKADIPALAAHFAGKYARRFGKRAKAILPEAMDELVRYPWPGNVRELENVMERAMILEEGGVIRKESLPIRENEPGAAYGGGLSVKKAQEAMERGLITKALAQTGNNKTKAAELLELSMRALLYKIKNYGL